MTRTSRELWLTPTETLASHHKFYPTKIQVAHHQLRHLISSAETDLIYYISQRDVYVLDLATSQNSLIATVPFESRCLAADLDWVCVGGEQNGDCAFIKVEKDEHDRPICFGHDFNHDLLGGEIVNSMSIHTILNHGKTPDEPVVLISNNDKTVKIYSLAQREVLTTLIHLVPMNFAAMSPDSSILAAVGDSDRVYFYRRRLYQDPDIIDGSCGRYAKYEWDPLIEPQVPIGEPVYDDYSFAVCFSPSGHLCASSSQGGSISVFDMTHLLNNESTGSSIICHFRSSRPQLFGCVRSMAFSPAPWDLLVWAEDHGKIGVADVRQGCVRRQILELDRQKSEEVKLEDGTPVSYRNISHKEKIKQQHLTRLIDPRTFDDVSSGSSAVFHQMNHQDLVDGAFRRRPCHRLDRQCRVFHHPQNVTKLVLQVNQMLSIRLSLDRRRSQIWHFQLKTLCLPRLHRTPSPETTALHTRDHIIPRAILLHRSLPRHLFPQMALARSRSYPRIDHPSRLLVDQLRLLPDLSLVLSRAVNHL